MSSPAPDHKARAHAALGASSAHRWLHCTAAPSIERRYPSADTQFTREGTLAHEVAEQCARAYVGGEVAPRGRASWLRSAIAKVDGADDDMAEHGKAYGRFLDEQMSAAGDGATALIESRVDYSEYAPGGFGTADCILVDPAGRRLTVIDYKYGKGVRVDAEGNPQMMLYALGAYLSLSDVYEFDEAAVCIYQPRLDHVSTWSLPVSDLLEWAEDTVRPAALEADAGGKTCPGEWCRFCRAAGDCKALADYSAELVGDDFDDESWCLDDAQMADALGRLPAIKAWANAIERAALDGLMTGSRTLPGWKAVESMTRRKLRDPEKAAEAMKGAGFDESMLYERKMLTLSALEKLAGKKRFAEIMGDLVYKPEGVPTLAPSTDRRRAISCADDFDAE